MPESLLDGRPLSEQQFAALVDDVKRDPARRGLLTDLLREDHPVYDERSTNETIRMRGWVLLAFEPLGLPDAALLFVLEELDNGRDPYLIAAAARVLQIYAKPRAAFAPLLVRAFSNIRDHDDAVCLERYGGYAVSEPGTTAVQEVLATLRWLGPHAHAVLRELEALRTNRSNGLSASLADEVTRTITAIGRTTATAPPAERSCCDTAAAELGGFRARIPAAAADAVSVESVLLEDQDGNRIRFGEFFRGQPSVVAFFYTRCNNPQKCSLTITKLARVQQLLAQRDLATRIHTAAITYDPAYDLPARLRGYGESRGVRMNADHRMFRAPDGLRALRMHFQLGVNFVQSLVNRHRIELYVLDREGRTAGSFERLEWDEEEVVDQAVRLLDGDANEACCAHGHHASHDQAAR